MKVFFYLVLVVSIAFSNKICIKNFNKQVCDNFKISNGVIIKSKLQREELKKRLNIDTIKQIAFLKNSNLYLIDTNTPIKDYERFKKLDFIEYSIPDIIQTKKSNF